ncbi:MULTISPECIES: hypothetical protein [Bizionia]|uniref:Uncharacterized protein n=1 Tax=Bizionia algoritergicola TaxID=291187 RepID=A0A5D0QU92_9FLAO|nr:MULTISPECIES: hypothetical protein [Bizionia]OBX20136.1 hypothetical protein BAA08_14925 [Bizionia sp. APA-3]TYB72376.1 hypothetical protein ES675_11475 [Bizionia algoritergicola]
MKTIIKSLCLLVFALAIFNCDNDDGDPLTSPNENVCNYQGLTALINNTQTLIPEAELQTDYFPNNDGPGIPVVEVFYTTDPGTTFIVTRALTLGAVDSNPEIRIDGADYAGVITCQRAGSAVGDELRFDILLDNGFEAELCVIIDDVTP